MRYILYNSRFDKKRLGTVMGHSVILHYAQEYFILIKL